MSIAVVTDLDYLLPALRLHLGDMDSTSYRYIDGWLRVSLVSSLKALGRWWGDRYLIDESDYSVTRNADRADFFEFDSPPVIMHRDERPIILMASVLIKSGSLENNSWSVSSWKDAEISVSTIASARSKEFSYGMDWDELMGIMKSPQKKLWGGYRSEIPGATELNE